MKGSDDYMGTMIGIVCIVIGILCIIKDNK